MFGVTESFCYLCKNLIRFEFLFKIRYFIACICLKKFTRCMIAFRSYSNRLDKLHIKSLEYRRLEFDCLLMYHITSSYFEVLPVNI